jgi:hypothetical protein
VGEFQALLLSKDAEQVKELEESKKEVEEIKGEWLQVFCPIFVITF